MVKPFPAINRNHRRRTAWIGFLVLLLIVGVLQGLRKPHSRPESSEEDHTAPSILKGSKASSPGHVPASKGALPEDATAPSRDLASVYASDEFIHVPEWIPRPQEAISASVDDASLRSDGLREGAVRYTLAAGTSETAEWLSRSLANAGLQVTADGSSYASTSLSRRCGVEMEHLSPEQTRITLRYQASDHGGGCPCPTCHGPEPASE